MFLEHALAETMDGEYGRFIHAGERVGEQDGRPGRIFFSYLRHELLQGFIAGTLSIQYIQGLADTQPHPAAQLFRGRPGKGDAQDLIHTELAFKQESQKEQDKSISLARSGARFQQNPAAQGQGEGIKQLHLLSP
jgi:hypothetical protein